MDGQPESSSCVIIAVFSCCPTLAEEAEGAAGDLDVVQARPSDADLEPRLGGDHDGEVAASCVLRHQGSSHEGHRGVDVRHAGGPLAQRQGRGDVGPDPVGPLGARAVAHVDEHALVGDGRSAAGVVGGEDEAYTDAAVLEPVDVRVDDGDADTGRAQHDEHDGDDGRHGDCRRQSGQDEALGIQHLMSVSRSGS